MLLAVEQKGEFARLLEVADLEADLLSRLADGTLPRGLAGLEFPAGAVVPALAEAAAFLDQQHVVAVVTAVSEGKAQRRLDHMRGFARSVKRLYFTQLCDGSRGFPSLTPTVHRENPTGKPGGG